MRAVLIGALLFLTLGCGICSAIAEAPAPVGTERWINVTYGHTLYPIGEKQWVQVDNKNGNVTKLTETGRNDDYVELYNPQRKVTLRLSSTRLEKKVGKEWRRVAQGHWDEGAAKEKQAQARSQPPAAALGIKWVVLNPKILKGWKDQGVAPPPVKIGVVVLGIVPDSPAEAADLRLLDVIYRADNQPVTDEAAWVAYQKTLQIGKPTFLHIVRIDDGRGKLMSKWARRKGTVIPLAAKDVLWESGRCPLKLLASVIKHNSIGEPAVMLSVRNMSPQDVVAYTVHLECYNRFDEPVEGLFGLSNSKRGIAQTTIESGEEETYKWTLHFHDTTTKVKITLERVRFEDGSEWDASGKDEVSIVGETGL